MAHNIAHIEGSWQAWYADKPAWHGLGTVTPGAKTAEQVIRAVPMFKREIETTPVFVKIGGKWIQVPDRVGTYRHGTTDVLGIVSTDFEKISDADALRTQQAVITAAGERHVKATFVTAGLLGRGEKAFASIDLSKLSGKVKRDPSRHETHLIGTWAHDGTEALRFLLYMNRVECQNMRNAALAWAEGKGLIVSIRHTGDMAAQLREAQRVLGFVEDAVKADTALMNALADIPVKRPHIVLPQFVEYVIPQVDEPEKHERAAKSREEAREAIKGLYTDSKTLVGVPPNAYRLFQATAEYADHFRPLRVSRDLENAADGRDLERDSADRRFRSIIEGPAADMKARALEWIRQEYEVPMDEFSGSDRVLAPVLAQR